MCNENYNRFARLYLDATEQRNDVFLVIFYLSLKFFSKEKLTMYSFSSPWPAQFDVRTLDAETKRVRISTPRRYSEVSTLFWPIT